MPTPPRSLGPACSTLLACLLAALPATASAAPRVVPGDQAARWAPFLEGLVHGPELDSLTLRVSTPEGVEESCGEDADACYLPDSRRIVIPGEVPPDGVALEELVAHEYGHHVAASRSNDPWDAGSFGPKRWATATGVCAGVREGRLFPFVRLGRPLPARPGRGIRGGVPRADGHRAGRQHDRGPSAAAGGAGARRAAPRRARPLDRTGEGAARRSRRHGRRRHARASFAREVSVRLCGQRRVRLTVRGDRGGFRLVVSRP